MTDLEQALLHNGITPPPEGCGKTTCPKCSPTRRKKAERCLSIKDNGVVVTWLCFHCKYHGSDVI
jgi:twinkle protein